MSDTDKIMSDIDKQKNEENLKRKMQYAPDQAVRLDKELFLAEYNTLRSEILQRLSQQTTLYQISITAWGLILGYALERIDDNKNFQGVILICVYPTLAFLLSSGWAFNQIRIGQIAQYLRVREKAITDCFGLMWWENYIKDEPGIKNVDDADVENFLQKLGKTYDLVLSKVLGKTYGKINGKIKPAIMIIIGTQIASILLALILIRIYFKVDSTLYIALSFIIVDTVITCFSFKLLMRSVGY